MDAKSLDPQLKAAFDRVMSTPVRTTSTPAPPPAAIPTTPPTPISAQPVIPAPAETGLSTPPPPAEPTPTVQPFEASPTLEPTQPFGSTTPLSSPAPAENPAVTPFSAPLPQPTAPQLTKPLTSYTVSELGSQPAPVGQKLNPGFSTTKSGSKTFAYLLFFGGIVFFIAYTVFWLKFFNIQLPF